MKPSSPILVLKILKILGKLLILSPCQNAQGWTLSSGKGGRNSSNCGCGRVALQQASKNWWFSLWILCIWSLPKMPPSLGEGFLPHTWTQGLSLHRIQSPVKLPIKINYSKIKFHHLSSVCNCGKMHVAWPLPSSVFQCRIPWSKQNRITLFFTTALAIKNFLIFVDETLRPACSPLISISMNMNLSTSQTWDDQVLPLLYICLISLAQCPLHSFRW